MSEFNNRISAQRRILSEINSVQWTEELFGLSSGAIRRWSNTNNLGERSELVRLVIDAAEKLLFLSNKSQEQITDEYKHLSAEVSLLTNSVASIIERIRVHGMQ